MFFESVGVFRVDDYILSEVLPDCRCVRLPDSPIEELSLQDSFPCGSQYSRYFRDLRGQVFPRLLQFGNKQPVGW